MISTLKYKCPPPPGATPFALVRYLRIRALKVNSYSNASVFLSLCRMRISVFWGQERLTDRSISKRCYLKSDIATWVEISSTSRAVHARDTGFYWSSENALHERFIASSGVGVWIKRYSSSQSDKKNKQTNKQTKNACIRVWIQLYAEIVVFKSTACTRSYLRSVEKSTQIRIRLVKLLIDYQLNYEFPFPVLCFLL